MPRTYDQGNHTFNGLVQIQAGAGSALARAGGVLYTAFTDAGNSGGTETNLHSYSIPASTLITNGMSIWFEALFSFAANSNSKTARILFGSTQIFLISSPMNNETVLVRGRIFRTGTSAQRAHIENSYGVGNGGSNWFSPAEATGSAITIKGTGQSGASASNDVIMRTFIVGWDSNNS